MPVKVWNVETFFKTYNFHYIDQEKDSYATGKMMGARTISQISEATSRTTNLSRGDDVTLSRSRVSITHKSGKSRHASAENPNSISSPVFDPQPELEDIIKILTTSSNLSLINTATGALQHLSYNNDGMKGRIRESGAIPILLHLLSLDDIVCISALGVLRNLSYGTSNHQNRMKTKVRTDSVYTQVLNHRPHWELLSSLAVPISQLGHSNATVLPTSESHAELSRFHTLNNLSQMPPSPSDHTYENYTYSPRPSQPRPSYLPLRSLPPGYLQSARFTLDSPLQNVALPADLQSWHENVLFSPRVKPSPMVLLRDLDRNLNYHPHAVLHEKHVRRLDTIELTPTFHDIVEKACGVICSSGGVPGDGCLCSAKDSPGHLAPLDHDQPMNIYDSCFSLLSAPASLPLTSLDGNDSEIRIDDFVATPGLSLRKEPLSTTELPTRPVEPVKIFSSMETESSFPLKLFSLGSFPFRYIRNKFTDSSTSASQLSNKPPAALRSMNTKRKYSAVERYSTYPTFENTPGNRSFSPIREYTLEGLRNSGMEYEPYGGDVTRSYREGDAILNVISNCEGDDELLPALLKDDVQQIEKRLLFYFRQLKNVKYCYDIVEKIAIRDAHGITLLVQLLNTTESYEIQELVTGVFWNLSSSENLKSQILKQALESLVKNIIVPHSGWKEGIILSADELNYSLTGSINWTTVFRNGTGCLKNLSSVGMEGRTAMRSCHGLVDSLLWTVRSAQGKNDVDNKAVENSVCILRNLSYRLEAEVSPEMKYGEKEDWRSRGLGGGQFNLRREEESRKKKKKGKLKEVNITPLPEHTTGVGLLWQPAVVRIYLDILLECSNPETLEGAAGALQNLTACSWEPAQGIREGVRREKGLSVITSLLRLPNDLVVRATAFCLRNLALDAKNKDLLGKNAMYDLVRRLPGGDGVDGITDNTISGILCAILETVTDQPDNARSVKDAGGIPRLVEISRSHDVYIRQCVVTASKILSIMWAMKDLRRILKQCNWNISMYTRSASLERSDGLEFDETRNQFKSSYIDPNHTMSSPDPTFDSHAGTFESHQNYGPRSHSTPPVNNGRGYIASPSLTSPLTTVTTSSMPGGPFSPPHPEHNRLSPSNEGHHPSPRSTTLGRPRDTVKYSDPYQDVPDIPNRGHSTLPSRGHHVTQLSANSNVFHRPPANNVNPTSKYRVADSWV